VLVSGDDVVVVASLGVAGGLASCGLASCVVLSVGSDVVVTALSGNVARVADFAFRVLSAIITAFTAVMFAFKLDAFSHHFFFWVHLPNTLHSPRCSARIPHGPHGFRGFRADSDLTSKGAHGFRVSPHRFRVSPCGFRASPHGLHVKLASQHPSKFRMNYSARILRGFHME
jgi:hypothetical protein